MPTQEDLDRGAKIRIKTLYDQHRGKTFQPSEVADSLGLEYGRTARLCRELADEGKIPALPCDVP